MTADQTSRHTCAHRTPANRIEGRDPAADRAPGCGIGSALRAATAGPAGTSVLVADPGDALVALFVPAG